MQALLRIPFLRLVCAAVLAGCMGSTEPATDVKFDSARLRAQGTADKGPAYSYFEYWPTSKPSARHLTPRLSWPAGAQGPFSQAAGPLVDDTQYSFRVCGNENGKSPAICAQTRTFVTPRATVDAVKGSWADVPTSAHASIGTVNASSAPNGTGLTGTVAYGARQGAQFGPYDYAGHVTCLSVDGHRAVVGSVGQARFDGGRPDPDNPNASLLVTVEDPGPGALDSVSADLVPSPTPRPCVAGSPGQQGTETLFVYDAP